jgi:nucleotide-binding universal stress UspA family protein
VVAPDGQVILLMVVDSTTQLLAHATPAGYPFNGAPLAGDWVGDIQRGQREDAAGHLAEARGLLEYGGVRRVETRIEEGVPGEVIVATALAEGCDLVAIATHGRSGLSRALLGSVANHVVRHLHTMPVLLVHPASAAERGADEAAVVSR